MDKKGLRAEMKRRNLALSADERREAARAVFRRVEALPAFRSARTVALFCALPDELPTDEALRRWNAERSVAVPRVEGETMRFFLYEPATLCRGAFGIDEPGPAACVCDASQIDLIVVPGTVFSPAGDRMGRGRGYYDRYLSQAAFRGVKVGVCYEHQLLDALPAEPHDVAMEWVCTPARCVRGRSTGFRTAADASEGQEVETDFDNCNG